MKRYFLNILIAIDQLVNAVFFGYPDETLSARCWRSYADGGQRKRSGIAVYVIDRIFFWDKDEDGDYNHCHSSYWHEMHRKDLPEEYREGQRTNEKSKKR